MSWQLQRLLRLLLLLLLLLLPRCDSDRRHQRSRRRPPRRRTTNLARKLGRTAVHGGATDGRWHRRVLRLLSSRRCSRHGLPCKLCIQPRLLLFLPRVARRGGSDAGVARQLVSDPLAGRQAAHGRSSQCNLITGDNETGTARTRRDFGRWFISGRAVFQPCCSGPCLLVSEHGIKQGEHSLRWFPHRNAPRLEDERTGMRTVLSSANLLHRV